MDAIFFDGWASVARIAIVAAAVYVLIVAALRVFGAQALAKMSAYDLIVTVALGSLVASIPLTSGITVSDGIVAALTFLLLQELTRRLQKRFRRVHRLVRQRPYVVLWDGEILQDELRRISISDDEVRGAVRQAGYLSLSQVQAVVLENDGGWSVLARSDARDLSALDGLHIPYTLAAGDDPAHWRNLHDEQLGPEPEDEHDAGDAAEDNVAGGAHGGDGRRAQVQNVL